MSWHVAYGDILGSSRVALVAGANSLYALRYTIRLYSITLLSTSLPFENRLKGLWRTDSAEGAKTKSRKVKKGKLTNRYI